MIFIVNGSTIESTDIDELIKSAFSALGTFDNSGSFIPADVETVRSWALTEVMRQAALAENDIDSAIANNPARITFLSTEIVDFYNNGQPTNPNPVRYVIANAMATRQGIMLYDMLVSLLARWINIRDRIADIMTELDRLIEGIEAAATKLEIGQILATMDFS